MVLTEPDWFGSEENHGFRSQVVQWLLHRAPAEQRQRQRVKDGIPRVVVQYWHDFNDLPQDVEACLNSWKELENEGFDWQCFDDGRARAFIAEHYAPEQVEAFERCYHPAMRCDYFRMCYILKCGGFYVDADEVYNGAGCEQLFLDDAIKIQPLCYDTKTEAMVAPEQFLTDTTFPSTRIFYVNNNPIVAPPGHDVIRLALRRSTCILLRRTERPEIQSTTGPGNLSACLVRYVIDKLRNHDEWDFTFLRDWKRISACQWFLSYRDDERNWRLLNAERRE